ncbi:MAG: hypothetical protein BWY76_01053 [bacterium ADurb.Bin429]|nr:MAG: hypothetical protein BWY76_01053 [bacterium ADurb.Bin429]
MAAGAAAQHNLPVVRHFDGTRRDRRFHVIREPDAAHAFGDEVANLLGVGILLVTDVVGVVRLVNVELQELRAQRRQHVLHWNHLHHRQEEEDAAAPRDELLYRLRETAQAFLFLLLRFARDVAFANEQHVILPGCQALWNLVKRAAGDGKTSLNQGAHREIGVQANLSEQGGTRG